MQWLYAVHVLCPSQYKHAFEKMGPLPRLCPPDLRTRGAKRGLADRQALRPAAVFQLPFFVGLAAANSISIST